MSQIAENLREVKERVAKAAQKAGREASEVQILAASKTRSVSEVREAIEAGISIIGENRVQEAEDKYNQIQLGANWHMIGHLQRNKVKKALEIFDMIQSVDSLRLAKEINKRALQMNRVIDILVEVNISSEETKYGIAPDEALDFIGSISDFEGMNIKGLMTVGPFASEPEKVRPCFAKLRELFEEIKSSRIPGVEMNWLSMGMTNDFEVAIEEGSNMVRIGTAIFGPRKHK